MITQEQRVKILAIYSGTHEKLYKILSHFDIVKDADFETSVFLFALSSITFPAHKEEIAETIGGDLFLYSQEDAGNKAVKRRLSLYGKAADYTVTPFAFWSPSGKEPLFGNPASRAFALFGDFLVFPECAENYGSCQWPLLYLRSMMVFSRIFTTRVASEVNKFVKAIADVLKEQSKEE